MQYNLSLETGMRMINPELSIAVSLCRMGEENDKPRTQDSSQSLQDEGENEVPQGTQQAFFALSVSLITFFFQKSEMNTAKC